MKKQILTAFALASLASLPNALGDCEYYTETNDSTGCNNDTQGTCSWDAGVSKCFPMPGASEQETYQPGGPEDQSQGDGGC